MTVAALECAALQRCSFLLSIKVRTPCTGHSVRGDFFLLFLLACLCELHRIRIVQAEMGLAGSRIPAEQKTILSKCDFLHMPSCLPACTSYPAGHRLWLAVFNRGCVFVVTVFLLGNFASLATFRGRHSLHGERRVAGDCTPDNSVQNENGTEIGEAHYGNVDSQLLCKYRWRCVQFYNSTLC